MQSVVSIITAATVTKLTTLARVKAELDITTAAHDVLLNAKIDEASSDIQVALGYKLPRETIRETFWHSYFEQPAYVADAAFSSSIYIGEAEDVLFLSRKSIASISSVTLDDDLLTSAEYRTNDDAGLLYRLDTDGYPTPWSFSKSVIVEYVAGYLLPGQANRNLDPAIEGAAVDLLTSFWLSRGRDPTLKSETIPGLIQQEYWIGTVGDPELLPPNVLRRIAPFRRPRMAVA